MSEFDNQTGILLDSSLASDYQVDDQSKRAIPTEVTYRFNSYSGCDISAIVHFYDETADPENRSRTKKLADLQTLTISSYREKVPVRALGHVGAKGYTRGPRTIGGSMIFTIFDKSVLAEMMVESYRIEQYAMDNVGIFNAVLIDQIPPFDITVLFANETGSMSRLAIYGVELVQEGQTMSVEDLVTESVAHGEHTGSLQCRFWKRGEEEFPLY